MGLLLGSQPCDGCLPHCHPQEPGHVVQPGENRIEVFQGTPSDPRLGSRRGKSQASNTARGFLGGNHKRLSLGWQNPQSHHMRRVLGVPWLPRPILAQDSTGSIFLWPLALLSSSNLCCWWPCEENTGAGGDGGEH